LRLRTTLEWVLTTTAGWAVGWSIGGAVGEVGGGAVSGFVGGSLAGLLQWLVVRRFLDPTGTWWAAATIGGWAAAVILGVAVEALTSGLVVRTIGAGIGLVLIAVAQWLYLRTRVSHAWIWLLANALGIIAGGGAVLVVYFVAGVRPASAPGGALLGLGLGIVTGVAFAWLLATRGSVQVSDDRPAGDPPQAR